MLNVRRGPLRRRSEAIQEGKINLHSMNKRRITLETEGSLAADLIQEVIERNTIKEDLQHLHHVVSGLCSQTRSLTDLPSSCSTCFRC